MHCCRACAGFTALLLAAGVMEWRAMLLVTAAITAERLSSSDARITRIIGVVMVCIGVGLLVSATVHA